MIFGATKHLGTCALLHSIEPTKSARFTFHIAQCLCFLRRLMSATNPMFVPVLLAPPGGKATHNITHSHCLINMLRRCAWVYEGFLIQINSHTISLILYL